MPAAPVPRDERSRLRTLRALGVLDSDPEAFSDAITFAAAAIADTPIATISLIDARRQWFKGAVGLEIQEMPREQAFCAYTILNAKRPLVVPDLRLDRRFSDHPAVQGEHRIRFYAGFPIVADGQPVGALCVMDDHPRTLSAQQLQRLATLAEGTASWLSRVRQDR